MVVCFFFHFDLLCLTFITVFPPPPSAMELQFGTRLPQSFSSSVVYFLNFFFFFFIYKWGSEYLQTPVAVSGAESCSGVSGTSTSVGGRSLVPKPGSHTHMHTLTHTHTCAHTHTQWVYHWHPEAKKTCYWLCRPVFFVFPPAPNSLLARYFFFS